MPNVEEATQPEVKDVLAQRQMHTELLKQQLAATQNRIKHQADKNRTDREFQVGEQVLLKLQPYAQSSVANRPFPKLAFKYYGPFKILERIGAAAYRLELHANSLIHNMFHVSQLRQFTPNFTRVFADLPKLTDFSQEELLPEAVLDKRLVKKGNAAIPQVRVKWAGLPDDSATWEDWYVLLQKFPMVAAWGQAGSPAGEGVTSAAFTEDED